MFATLSLVPLFLKFNIILIFSVLIFRNILIVGVA